MQINLKKSALKDLKSIDKKEQNKIIDTIEKLKQFPKVSNIKRLKNFTPTYRLRVGNYRILFDVKEDTIIIGRILHRKEAY